MHLSLHEPRAHRVHIQIKSTFFPLIFAYLSALTNECTASVQLLLVCILAGKFFLNECDNLGLSIWLSSHRFHVLLVSLYFKLLFHSYLGPYNCKYAFTRMTEAASLSARLVSSPLALLSWEVYVLRHILPKMLPFCLVCLAFLFSSCAILKLCTLQIRHRFHSIYLLFLLVSFVFFIPRDRPIVFFSQWINGKIYLLKPLSQIITEFNNE